MCTLTEKANAYIAALPTEERFAALRGFFAGFETAFNDIGKLEPNEKGFEILVEWQKEMLAFKAGDYRQQPKTVASEQRTVIEAGLVPLDAWTRL